MAGCGAEVSVIILQQMRVRKQLLGTLGGRLQVVSWPREKANVILTPKQILKVIYKLYYTKDNSGYTEQNTAGRTRGGRLYCHY